MYLSRGTRWFLRIGTGITLAFIYLPLIIIALYAFNSRRTQTWPIPGFTFSWFEKACTVVRKTRSMPTRFSA